MLSGGNVYADDSNFCRHCGLKRSQAIRGASVEAKDRGCQHKAVWELRVGSFFRLSGAVLLLVQPSRLPFSSRLLRQYLDQGRESAERPCNRYLRSLWDSACHHVWSTRLSRRRASFQLFQLACPGSRRRRRGRRRRRRSSSSN